MWLFWSRFVWFLHESDNDTVHYNDTATQHSIHVNHVQRQTQNIPTHYTISHIYWWKFRVESSKMVAKMLFEVCICSVMKRGRRAAWDAWARVDEAEQRSPPLHLLFFPLSPSVRLHVLVRWVLACTTAAAAENGSSLNLFWGVKLLYHCQCGRPHAERQANGGKKWFVARALRFYLSSGGHFVAVWPIVPAEKLLTSGPI